MEKEGKIFFSAVQLQALFISIPLAAPALTLLFGPAGTVQL